MYMAKSAPGVHSRKFSCICFTKIPPGGMGPVDWVKYRHCPVSKEELVFYCNVVWPTCILDFGERCSLNVFLNCCIILQLELYCYQFNKQDKIQYVSAFVSLF